MFISYRKLSYFILVSFLSVMMVFLYYSVIRVNEVKMPTIFTMCSIIKTYTSISIDTNGNGKKDIINISVDDVKKEYRIEILNDDNKVHVLMPDPGVKAIGPYVPWWPLQITIADINMDGIGEILVQLSRTNASGLSYIFRWNGKQYSKILSGSWRGISLNDVTGDRVPEIITEDQIPGTGEIYNVYSWVLNSYNKIYVNLNFLERGYDKIKHIINLLNNPFNEKLPDQSFLSLHFTEDWLKDSKNLQYLNNFARDIAGIQLQDYLGEEPGTNHDNNGNIVVWKLRYIVFRKFGTELRVENYIAEIQTEKTGKSNLSYKIKDIKFKGQ